MKKGRDGKLPVNKNGYYDGPGGVFYDPYSDAILEIEYSGINLHEPHVGLVGKLYTVRWEGFEMSPKVLKMGNQVRLGDL